MAEAVQHFLNIFELLPDEEKREVALEILKELFIGIFRFCQRRS